MRSLSNRWSILATCAPLLLGSACDGDDGDSAGDTHSHGTHDSHGEHGEHGDTDGSDENTMLEWVDMPAVADGAVSASFMIHTMGELHVAELRACAGADVAECGLGAMDSFESAPAAEQGGMAHMRMGSLTLDPGDWTVVAYVHVGANPHVSDAVNVTVP